MAEKKQYKFDKTRETALACIKSTAIMGYVEEAILQAKFAWTLGLITAAEMLEIAKEYKKGE